jgi:spectrin alpha
MNTLTFSVVAGRDLIGVQNLMKKHQALAAEVAGHEPRIHSVSQAGHDMVEEGHFAADDIKAKVDGLNDKWKSLVVRSSRSSYVLLGQIGP